MTDIKVLSATVDGCGYVKVARTWPTGTKVKVMIDEEPTPKWEPGTVVQYLHNENWLVRLDKFLGMVNGCESTETWDAVTIQGLSAPSSFERGHWKTYRLPHEFKVGDWAQSGGETFRVQQVRDWGPQGWGIGPDRLGHWYLVSGASHVPPPKEEKPSDHEFGMQAQAEEDKPSQGIADLIDQEAWKNRTVETSEKPENPFTGPQWDRLDNGQRRNCDHARCIRDLRDELNRLAGRKK